MIYAMIIHSAMVPWSFILHHLAISTDTVLPRGARISAGQFQYNSWAEVWARSGSFGTSGRVESRQGAFHMASPSAWLCLRASSELWDAGRGVRALREPLVSQWWSFGTHHVSPLQSGGEHGGYSRVEGSGGSGWDTPWAHNRHQHLPSVSATWVEVVKSQFHTKNDQKRHFRRCIFFQIFRGLSMKR